MLISVEIIHLCAKRSVRDFDSVVIEMEMLKMVETDVYLLYLNWKMAQMSGSYLHPLLLGHFMFLNSMFFWYYMCFL